jgi:selenocysteine-specific elongation factor
VDVPGHVRFLKNMLAGVGGIDACLFVVAATEGGSRSRRSTCGSSSSWACPRRGGAHQGRPGRRGPRARSPPSTSRTTWPAPSCRAPRSCRWRPDRDGLDALRAALDELVATTPAAPDRGRPRLWIDRVFAAKGPEWW